jgi:hypothetical protein
MALFKSETPLVAFSLAVRKRQSGKNDTRYQNATDDDVFCFHDDLLTVCFYVFNFSKAICVAGFKLTLDCEENMKNRWEDREESSIVLKLMLKYIRSENRLSPLPVSPFVRKKISSDIFPISAGPTGQLKALIYFF